MSYLKIYNQPLNALILIIFLTAPYFYIRQYGFDFSKGTSFSLVDFFLLLTLLTGAYSLFKNPDSILPLNKNLRNLFIIGGIFVLLCLISGFTADMSGVNHNINWKSLLSGTLQYAFILLILPLLANIFLKYETLRTAIRFIALGYLFPMLINIAIAPVNMLPELREMFFVANRALGTYGNANSFAEVLVITFPLYIYLIAKEKGLWQLTGYIGLIALLDCLVLSGSFSGLITFVTVIIMNMILLAFWKKNPLRRHVKQIFYNTLILSALFILSYIGLSYYAPTLMEKTENRLFLKTHAEIIEEAATDFSDTVNTRMELNYRGLDLLIQRNGGIFYGHGLRQTANLPQFNFGGNGLDVHLLYLLLWIEGGFILAVTFGIYLLLLLKNCITMAKTNPSEALVFATSVIAIMVFALFLPHNYLRYFWVPLLPAFLTINNKNVDSANG